MNRVLKKAPVSVCIFCVAMFLGTPASSESLYDERTYNAFVGDERAHRVGDVVTLLIVESASAKSIKDFATDKNVDISAGFSTGVIEVGSANVGRTESGGADLRYSREDAKATARQGSFRGQITVEVKEIDDAGKMLVAGMQKIVINGEEQIIRASGWLRARDIDENNTVLSIRLGDARIEYVDEVEESRKGAVRKAWDFVKRIW